MKRLLYFAVPVALLAGAGYCLVRHFGARRALKAPALPGDELLTQRVMVSLQRAGAMPERLRVRVLAGTVHLTGTVTGAERDRVLRAVLAAPGIRGVRNGLTVVVESPPWEPSPEAR